MGVVQRIFYLRCLYLFRVLLLASVRDCNCCGPGNGGTLLSVSTNQDSSGTNVLSWLPVAQESSDDGAVLNFLNDNLQKTFGKIKSQVYYDGSQGTILCPSDLDCSFEDDEKCRWRNSLQDDIDFYLTRGKPDIDKWEIYLGTRDIPEAPFLTAAGNKGDYRAWLVSDPVQEQPGDGIIKFKYWATPMLEIRVCTKYPESAIFNFCSETLDRNGVQGPAKVIIPGPIDDPFEIVIETKNFITDPGGIAFVDDIEYIASPSCDREKFLSDLEHSPRNINISSRNFKRPTSSTVVTTLPPTTKTPVTVSTFKDVALVSDECNAIPCDFEGGSSCGYSFNSTKSEAHWRIENRPVGNRATGIQKDVDGNDNFINAYMLASGRVNGSSDVFVASSRPFRLSQPISVSFFKHIMSSPAHLRVCLVNFSYCPRTFEVNLNERGWRNAVVEFRPDSLPLQFQNKPVKLLFVAENLKQNNFIGVDNIKVLLKQGSVLC